MITAAGDWNRDGRNDVLMRDTKSSGWLWMVPGRGRRPLRHTAAAEQVVAQLHLHWPSPATSLLTGARTSSASTATAMCTSSPSTASGTLGAARGGSTVGTPYNALVGAGGT